MREPAGKPCIRCLIRDLPDGEQLAEIIRERNELLPEGKRAALPRTAGYLPRLPVAEPRYLRAVRLLCGDPRGGKSPSLSGRAGKMVKKDKTIKELLQINENPVDSLTETS